MALNYQNLGAATAILIQDSGTGNSLVVNGTGANDTYAVSTGGSGFSGSGEAQQAVAAADKRQRNGADAQRQRPAAFDIVNLAGPTGPIGVTLADSTIPTNTTITGYGAHGDADRR